MKTKKYIHICPDEKFITPAAELFWEIDKENHEFIIYSKNKNLNYENKHNMKVFTPYSLIKHIIGNIDKFKHNIVIFHSVQRLPKLISLILPKDTITVWIGFGYDYYCYESKRRKSSLLNEILDKLFLARINYFAPVLETEYELVKKHFPKFKAKLLDWNYDLISGFLKKEYYSYGENILLGNSATETNNHPEIIEILSELNVKKEIIIPLSYGSNNYKKKILSLIKSKKLSITPLTEYLAIDDYYSKLGSCSHVIMNHNRQQAYGNIAMALFMGSKIFLRRNNPLYEYLVKKGFTIYSIEDIPHEINTNLDEDIKNKNRALIEKFFSRNAFIEKTRNFISNIL
ncbi:TDP-N-acetylfucosamine:lipid II N-acetylfucosaminyltransferase [Providencia alcalifaciens]|uniref:TDP-N-acetylfucosamine:lipid II N-acetylfucosaminyltransferase n=1 Tax=Providencia alcalifaciens TaxID=126385 RepID=UPI001CC6EA40|nr:TDP-N-acetylfucosamine:lipid II N-acetylfucosaminyltransferase [Providencia alcalifaciens]CAG9431327.1 TDP-N-acetylfucosamine:lipid II N-acetylfucosaminyltransferase [Providencia alcalifaciens]CAG9434463.1 TDP-N-acetylfucosamine:lipid II N-acetylfucosaminyltransferase [Providencia alcalifaciens]CAG9434569.1 TDP-N-acetylfucosamine:lipid II N-acetylfucosaminyltransferase [Providencia alcalifaciens]CAG9435056.1 TDP-N-acetylfucosamine:lipid II N-acetylfucosaminyltransferase [Providencia alcalifa